jgi:predicted deacetylase
VSARLLVSLSGIRAATLGSCQRLTEELDSRGVRASLLVVPRRPGPVDWVRHRRAGGDAVLLHGYDHTADPIGAWGPHTVTRIGRRAEFAALPCHEAGLRLLAGDRLLGRLGLRTDAFAPPRWLASPGTLRALRRAGFAVCADATAVHDLRAGVARRGRVLGFGAMPTQHAEPWWCRAMVLGAARAARRGGLVRLAVDATDLTRAGRRSALLDAVDIALHHGAQPGTYAALPAGLPLAA